MKNGKRFFIGFISCALILGIGAYALFNDNNDSGFDATTLDAVTSDGSDIKEGNAILKTIPDNDTPLATIGGNSGGSKNLTTSQVDSIRTSLQNYVNQERKAKKIGTVAKYATLEKTGDIRAKEILKKWSHERPDGTSWSTVLTSNGISKTNLKAGEDLAKITFNAKSSYSASYIEDIADEIHETLMNSPTHKSVILNSGYSEIGVGMYSVLSNNKVTVYVTEHFKNKTVNKVTAPKKVTLSSAKSSAKKKITVKYKKPTGASGYQIAYKKKGTSKWYYKYTTKTSYTLSKLTSKKYYYVKVRAYKTSGGKRYYGTYSTQKSVKVK